jgi:hypothetical protein
MDAPYFYLESLRDGMAGLGFDELRQRLIRFVVGKIRDGEFTERGLARQLGVSQPQLHNVLKGARVLKPELGDTLLSHLGMTLLDLLSPRELNAASLAIAASLAWRAPRDDKAARPFGGNIRKKPPRGETQAGLQRKANESKLAS